MKKLKPKKCRICKAEYQPFNSLQKVCGVKCAVEMTNKNNAAKEKKIQLDFRRETRERKIAMKSKSKWLAEAQTACNAYIRERDKGIPCISCGNTNDVKYCAGHYKTRGGHPELRFHPMNIHRQCDWHCNMNLSGNIAEYRPKLIEKIGLKNVEWLEGKHEQQNLTIDDIAEIKQYYKEQLKNLKS